MVLYNSNEERCEVLARYVIENNSTVRETAKVFGISKSTVHKDITEKLSKINFILYETVFRVLEKNKSERHIRGGEATKRKYSLNSNKNSF